MSPKNKTYDYDGVYFTMGPISINQFAEFSKQKLSIVSMRNKTNRLEELFIGMVEKNLEPEKTHNE